MMTDGWPLIKKLVRWMTTRTGWDELWSTWRWWMVMIGDLESDCHGFERPFYTSSMATHDRSAYRKVHCTHYLVRAQ